MESDTISTTSTDATESHIAAKLRRLKIEEQVLIKNLINVRKWFENIVAESEELEDCNYLHESKEIRSKLRNCFIEIRDLLEEIKDNTSSKQNLRTLDIDDVKKDVTNLERKLGNLKSFIQIHLKNLKLREEELENDCIAEDQTYKFKKVSRKTSIKNKPFNEAVPSPVKNLINSPYKCPEIQKFQEFMANSKNRYGGWNPYYHNIFEKTWHKYFCTQKNIEDYDYQEANVENSKLFFSFLIEICEKIPEFSVEEIILHNKWYTKFLYLKERQKRALEKWKSRKQIIKEGNRQNRLYKLKAPCLDLPEDDDDAVLYESEKDSPTFEENNTHRSIEETFNSFSLSDETDDLEIRLNDKVEKSQNKVLLKSQGTYRKSTQQWTNRCKKVKETTGTIMDVQALSKRRVPDWRFTLQDHHE